MLDYLAVILEEECSLEQLRPVVVGVSGGPDSLSLSYAMHRLGYPVVFAHLNHALRDEADTDARHVAQFAASLGLASVVERQDVASYAREHSMSIEEAAREVRYRFLFAQAARLGAQAVAVAHTADDQVETVLMHLLRGAGLAGLRGMPFRLAPNPWSSEIPLVRPLLSTWRAQVLEFCAAHNLQSVTDRSNLDTTFFRNRLRHELIPLLEEYNPGLRQHILQMAHGLQADYQVIQAAVEQAWKDCLVRQGDGFLAFDRGALARQPMGIQRHLLRRAIAIHRPGLRDIDFASIERVLAFIRNPTRTGQRDLVAGLRLSLEGECLWLASWGADLPGDKWPQLTEGQIIPLEAPGSIQLEGDWRLHAEPVELSVGIRAQALENEDPFRAWLDLAQIGAPLFVRARRPGDRFQPLGMGGGAVRLAEFMLNQKLPRRARAGWPLVCCGEEIAWVAGLRLDERYRLEPASQSAIFLRLERT